MSGMNNVCLVGRLTADVEMRKTQSGLSVAHFTVAVDRRTKDAGADFIRCIAWRQSAEFIAQYGTKGRMIGIVGHIKTGSYDDKDTGKKVYTTDIECDSVALLDSRKDVQNASQESNVAAPVYRTAYETSIANGFTQEPEEDADSLPW